MNESKGKYLDQSQHVSDDHTCKPPLASYGYPSRADEGRIWECECGRRWKAGVLEWKRDNIARDWLRRMKARRRGR